MAQLLPGLFPQKCGGRAVRDVYKRQIIGRIYPIFGAILLFSAVGVFIGMFVKGYPLLNVWDDWSCLLYTSRCV